MSPAPEKWPDPREPDDNTEAGCLVILAVTALLWLAGFALLGKQ